MLQLSTVLSSAAVNGSRIAMTTTPFDFRKMLAMDRSQSTHAILEA
jgi:hypothetical protein